MTELVLMNARTGRPVASHVDVAVSRQARRRGLLGRTTLKTTEALVLAPCAAIHTLFMRFAIDVVFVGGDGRVLRVVRDLPPWSMAIAPLAAAVIELPAGAIGSNRVAIGDQLYLDQNGERLEFAASALRTSAARVPRLAAAS
jgi:uncharacterized protein